MVRSALGLMSCTSRLMSTALTVCEGLKLVNRRAITEASGGVNESTVVAIAETGVDVVSVGDLTHTVKAVDISLDVQDIKPSALRTIGRMQAAG